jgi:hypothetical protein
MKVQKPLSMPPQVSLFERGSALAFSTSEGVPFDETSQSRQQHVLGVTRKACPLESCSPSTASRNEESRVDQRRDDEEDGDDDDDDFMLRNKYLDSFNLLKKNKIVIDRLTKRLSMIEKETSSIASELDAIETKISPMLSLHVPSYETSCSNNEDATMPTCTSTTLSKTRSPDRDCPQEQEASTHRYMSLSDECLLNEIGTLSALFCSDLSSISKCLSEQEVYDKRMSCHSVDACHVDELLQNKNIVESVVISLEPDEMSEITCLSAIPHQDDDNHILATTSIIGSFVSTHGGNDDDEDLLTDFGNASTATFERTGQKSHLYSFPDELCCLFIEPSQDMRIPASENDEGGSCFILGIKNRNKEDECGCIIC